MRPTSATTKERRRVLIVAKTTWNSATLIETFIRHYRGLGIARGQFHTAGHGDE